MLNLSIKQLQSDVFFLLDVISKLIHTQSNLNLHPAAMLKASFIRY